MNTRNMKKRILKPGIAFVAMCWGICLPSSATAAVIAWWEFQPASLTADSSGNGHTLSNTGVVASATSGAVTFSAGDILKTTSTLDLTSYDQITLEFFYKTSDLSGTRVFVEHSANYNDTEGAFIVHAQDGQIWSYVNEDPTKPGTKIGTPPLNIWTHYALEIDATTGNVSTYINGTLTDTDSQPIASLANADLYIGSRNGGLSYVGDIGNFRISDGLLAPSEFLTAVPEPSTTLLVAVGVFAVLFRVRAKYTRRNRIA